LPAIISNKPEFMDSKTKIKLNKISKSYKNSEERINTYKIQQLKKLIPQKKKKLKLKIVN
jgi:hypothetical protein